MAKLALIPARGGSKRLPRKNVLPFLGKPILAYTIDAARQAALFDDIIVSTEDAEIAAIAREYGANVDWRPVELAGDNATISQVCRELLQRKRAEGRDYRQLCCLYATAPLRNAEDIRAVMNLLESGECHFALAATAFTHYPHQALKLASQGGVEPMWPELCNIRADKIGALVAGNGSTYAVDVAAFLEHGEFYGPAMRAHLMPFMRSVDIDTADDFMLAECLGRGMGLA
ncbi:MAG TPA: acylneuraminate cytidylyltransferase family protein [Pseudogulbenkiania sp.]|nr:acylneuraminate cytidylyltransferase family protein [Pseudogulbenkiania sp.]